MPAGIRADRRRGAAAWALALAVVVSWTASAEQTFACSDAPRVDAPTESRGDKPDAKTKLPPLGERFANGSRHLVQDARYLVTFPARPTKKGVVTASAVLAGTAVLFLLDDEIRREVQEARNDTLDRWEERIEPFGSGAVTGGAGVLVYLGGRIAHNERVTETGRSIAESVFFTQLFTVAAKASFGRDRPSPGRDAGEFFNGESAFPSGHTSRAFAVATVLAKRHGKVAAWVAYPIATLVGLMRIENDVHWASDVLAGAALGYGVARGVLHVRDSRRTVSVFPTPAPAGANGAGITLRWSF